MTFYFSFGAADIFFLWLVLCHFEVAHYILHAMLIENERLNELIISYKFVRPRSCLVQEDCEFLFTLL